ncbi:MAG: hypothetical protein ACKPEA_04675 [Planctomycetota bacterium]
MNLQAVYGLFAQGVIVAAIIRLVRVLLGKARPKPHGIELWLPVMLLLAGAADGVSLAGHVRGLWGDPSVVSLLILFLFTLQPTWLPRAPRPSTCVALTALVTLPLYAPLFVPIPAVQGGLYELGYQPRMVLAVIAIGWALLSAVRGMDSRWLVILAIALFAYAGRVMESDNLFDYLVDPGLLLAIAFLGFTGICTSLQRRLKPI